MARQTSKGKCLLCKKNIGKSGVSRHLKTCREAAYSEKFAKSREQKLFHIVVEGEYAPFYWLHLDVPAKTTLRTIDGFLRGIWLECCGHMSMFKIEGIRYMIDTCDAYDDEERDMNIAIEKILAPKMKFFHEYDFGSTTCLTLRVVGENTVKFKGKQINLLARNDPPPIPCGSCGKLATQVCTICMCSEEGWFCDKCASKHDCEDMFLPVVNSPRVGTCGYTGE